MDKNKQIQFFRGIFCLLIVFYHCFYKYCQLYNVDSIFFNNVLSHLGAFGVCFFFILSGYFLIPRKNFESKKELVNYWIKRACFLWILYFIVISIIFLFSLTSIYCSDRKVSFYDYLKNIFFINYIMNSRFVDGSHWYIVYLIVAYGIIFLFQIFNLHKNEKAWTFLLFASIALNLMNKYFGEGNIGKVFNILSALTINQYLSILIIGISLYFIIENGIKKSFLSIINLCLAIIFLSVFSWVYIIYLLIILPIIIFAIFHKLKFLEDSKLLVFIGNASLSIYLIHQNICYTFITLFRNYMNIYISSFLAFLIVIILGIIIYVIIEKNVKKFISKLFE